MWLIEEGCPLDGSAAAMASINSFAMIRYLHESHSVPLTDAMLANASGCYSCVKSIKYFAANGLRNDHFVLWKRLSQFKNLPMMNTFLLFKPELTIEMALHSLTEFDVEGLKWLFRHGIPMTFQKLDVEFRKVLLANRWKNEIREWSSRLIREWIDKNLQQTQNSNE
jgi:hypothetical protein